jgi:TolB-like protein/DNA-binding SARP family transcriptional activator
MSGTDQSPKRAQLRLLGGFDLHSADGRAAIPAGRKVRALLACLALSPEQARPREKLMALLWSDRSDEQARASLRQALVEMRRVLGDPSPVRAEHDAVSLDPTCLAVDALDFERLAKAGKWEEAAALYRGPLLDGHGVRDDAFEDWIRVERTRLHDLAVDVLERLTGAQSGEAAIATAQQLLQLDPAREETHRLLMRLYASIGQRAQALRQYDHCRDVLQRDLQAKPDAETERLYRQIQHETVPPPATPPTPAASGPHTAPSDKPSIAVLPFTNLSGDPEQQYFSDGITEDIITELSRFRSLFVIARPSSFQFRDRAVDVRRIGRELGVQYVVEGSIRRSGDRLRVTTQLIEAETGSHIWAERYDRDLHDIFDVQDELARAVAATVSGRIDMVGRERSARLNPAALKAHDLHLRAKACYLTFTKSGNEQARHLAEEAMAADPLNALIKAFYANYCVIAYFLDWAPDLDRSLKTALEFAKQAVTLDDGDSTVRWILGHALVTARSYAEARVHAEKAIELNPNDTEARAMYGNLLTYIGEPEKGLEQIELAKRHNPFDWSWTHWVKGIAYFTARRYGEAIATFNRMHDPNQEVHCYLAASYALADRLHEARAELRKFLHIAERDMTHFPGQDAQGWMNYLNRAGPYLHRRDLDHLCDGVRKAGLPI